MGFELDSENLSDEWFVEVESAERRAFIGELFWSIFGEEIEAKIKKREAV